MQYLATATALFASLSLALPAPQTNPAHGGSPPDPNTYENIDIADLYLRKNPDVQAVGFKLSGENATDLDCSASVPELTFPSQVFTCGDSKYRFALVEGESSDYALRIYHELGTAFGFYGAGDAPLYCRAGGNGPQDYVCQQTNAWTIVIDNGPPVDSPPA